jgi:GNAT superfamily N-acetyltransferase
VDVTRADLVVLDRGADDPALVGRAYREVLEPSFTTDEIPPAAELVDDAAGATVVVAVADGLVLAAAITDPPTTSPVALLSYLAVRPDRRAGGIGSTVLRALQSRWADGAADVVLGEVHDPRCWSDSDDERPRDRLRFYERHGARLLSAPWVQPRLRDGGHRVGGMLLLVMGGRAVPDAVPAALVRQWMTDYYADAEGIDDPSRDPTLAALLARASAVDPIPVRPVADHPAMPLLDASAGS